MAYSPITLATPPLVVLEGLDGVGKSTAARLLADRLDAVLLSTPPHSVRGFRAEADLAFPRRSPSATLFYAACNVAAAEEALAHLNAGRTVVLDRYWLSTRAYARVLGTELALPEVDHALPRATFTFYLGATAEARAARLARRAELLEHDRQTLAPAVATAIDDAFHELLASPIAGLSYRIDTTSRSPSDVADLLTCLVLAGVPSAVDDHAPRPPL